jgi:Fe-S cluster assembly protein SufD
MSNLIQDVELFGSNIPWLEGLREKARSSFVLPTVKNEPWKYTKLHSITSDDFRLLPSRFIMEMEEEIESDYGCNCGHEHNHNQEHCSEGCGEHGCDCDGRGLNLFLQLPFDAYQLHFSNGKFVPIYPAIPRGVEIMTLMEAVVLGEAKSRLGKHIELDDYPFAALNTAYLEEGLFVRIDKNTQLEKPIMMVNHTAGGEQNILANIRNLIIIEGGAKAEIVEYYHYTGELKSRYFNNIVNEIYVSAQAELRHYKFQNEAFKAIHIALNFVRVDDNGIYNGFCLQKGADLGRNETKVSLLDEQAKAEINTAYIMNGWATLDTNTHVEHLSPLTFSSQLLKGVIGGEARGVFQGKIYIARDAQETEGRLLHKALLLSDTAEIDVKPELEIFADNVKCAHGAACGELDKEQLFYMRSRGINEDDAKQILIDAYLDDVFERIDNKQVREWIKDKVRE